MFSTLMAKLSRRVCKLDIENKVVLVFAEHAETDEEGHKPRKQMTPQLTQPRQIKITLRPGRLHVVRRQSSLLHSSPRSEDPASWGIDRDSFGVLKADMLQHRYAAGKIWKSETSRIQRAIVRGAALKTKRIEVSHRFIAGIL